MKILGFTISRNDGPESATREDITGIYDRLQEFDDRLELVEKRAEANRVRISQLAGKKSESEAEELLHLQHSAEDEISTLLERSKQW